MESKKSESLKEQYYIGLAIVIGSFLAISFVWCTALYRQSEEGWKYVLLLFLIPFLFQLPVICRTKKTNQKIFYSIACFISTFSYLFLWWLYGKQIFSERLSIASLICAFFLVLCVFCLTYYIMRSRWHDSSNKSESGNEFKFMMDIAKHMRERSFLTLCFFLSVFLSVTYLLSFAFAFHDRFVQSCSKQEETRRVALYTVKPAHYGDNTHTDKTTNHSSLTVKTFIRFREYSAELIWYKRKLDACKEEITGAFIREGRDAEDIAIAINNNPALSKIIQTINNINKASNYKRIRVQLIGYCSKESAAGHAYRSNYELSQARVQRVQLIINNLLTAIDNTSEENTAPQWYNVEWLLTPLSSESHQIYGGQNPEEWRKVDVSVTQLADHITELQMVELKIGPERLNLLDYIYFTIYTITTSAYGDIIPVTALAKFIVSIANLFELFFIVVFFNVLVSSFKKQGK